MLNLNMIPTSMVLEVAMHMGWNEQPSTLGRYIDLIGCMDAKEFVDKFLSYNGIIGFTDLIIEAYTRTLLAEKATQSTKLPQTPTGGIISYDPNCNFLDVTAPKYVQVLCSSDRHRVWVNVDGMCLFRACRIEELEFKHD